MSKTLSSYTYYILHTRWHTANQLNDSSRRVSAVIIDILYSCSVMSQTNTYMYPGTHINIIKPFRTTSQISEIHSADIFAQQSSKSSCIHTVSTPVQITSLNTLQIFKHIPWPSKSPNPALTSNSAHPALQPYSNYCKDHRSLSQQDHAFNTRHATAARQDPKVCEGNITQEGLVLACMMKLWN